MLRLRIQQGQTLGLANRLAELSEYRPGIVKAFHDERKMEVEEESETQFRVAEYIQVRRIQQTGYLEMLEKAMKKRQQAIMSGSKISRPQ